MRAVVVVALGLLVASCGRRNFNDDASVDSTSPLDARECTPPATGCMDGNAYTCGGVCYVTCSNTVTRPLAASVCEGWGGCLATIESQAANNCVAGQVSGGTWIGALQDNNAFDVGTDWRWCTGDLITYVRWETTAPNDSEGIETGQEQCATILTTGDWTDISCAEVRPFICSRPL